MLPGTLELKGHVVGDLFEKTPRQVGVRNMESGSVGKIGHESIIVEAWR
jgi:hypothetical protein